MQPNLLSMITIAIFILLILSGLVLIKELFLGNSRQLNSQTRKLVSNYNHLSKDKKNEVENLIKKLLKDEKENKESFFDIFKKKQKKILIEPVSEPEILEKIKKRKAKIENENFEDLAKI